MLVRQKALAQEINMQLVDIREKELKYYSSFYVTFGGISAVLCGFLRRALTDIHYAKVDKQQYSHETFDTMQALFWIW